MAVSFIVTLRRKIPLLLVVACALGLLWGQVRLPLAAIKGLRDYPLVRDAATLSATDQELGMSALQKWYLRRSLNVQAGATPPRVAAKVKWNWGLVARVESGHYIAPSGSELLDGVYVCVFGAWFRVYTFNHYMA